MTFPNVKVDESLRLFWHKGLEQAPELVKVCYRSVEKYAGQQVIQLTHQYMQDYIRMPEYLFSNIAITQIMKLSLDVEKEMPYLNSDYSEYLVKLLGDTFTEDGFKCIKELTGIHKLTYKLDLSIDKEGTVYHYLMRELYNS